MTEHPFAVFRPFSDRLRVRLYDRSDDLHSSDDVRRLEGLPLAEGEQTHGPLVMRVNEAGLSPAMDGIATDTTGLALGTRGADCQIFAVYDPVHHAGGVLHAGWRGLVARAIPAFVDLMRREWGSDPADLVVGAGPSLCFACSEFTDPIAELTGIDARFFRGRLADLRSIADDQWMSAGVKREHIERHPDCTKCDVSRWWSLRGGDKEALRSGSRNMLVLVLR